MTALLSFAYTLWNKLLSMATWFLHTFGIAGCAVIIILLYYNGLVIARDIPFVGWFFQGEVQRASDRAVKEATKDLVAASEKANLVGQITELKRQLKVIDTTAAIYQASATQARKEADDAKAKLQAAIAADNGADGCVVGPDDLDWMSKH